MWTCKEALFMWTCIKTCKITKIALTPPKSKPAPLFSSCSCLRLNVFFAQSSWWPLWSLYQIWKRYGWVPLKYANLAKKEFLTRFKMIYKHLGAGKAYASPKEMLEDVNMFEYTQTTARELLMV